MLLPACGQLQPALLPDQRTSFDRSNSPLQLWRRCCGTQGRVLLRFVNAGLRMHVPSIVGANMTLLPRTQQAAGLPKVQVRCSRAGKTYDVTIQPKQTTAEPTIRPPLRSLIVRSDCRPTTSATAHADLHQRAAVSPQRLWLLSRILIATFSLRQRSRSPEAPRA